MIQYAPSVGLLKVERPEIVAWDLEQYARVLAAAKLFDPNWDDKLLAFLEGL